MRKYAQANNLIGRNCTGKKDNGVQCLIGGGDNEQDMLYWSSSEYSGKFSYLDAWYQRFRGGDQYHFSKYAHLGVRAIRAFNNLTIQQFNHLAAQVMTGEAIYEQIAEMPREIIGIITGYATADISRDRMEKDRSEIA